MRRALLPVLFFGFVAAAQAGTLADATALYDAGNFLAAEKAGEALGTADGFALAARAEIAIHGLDKDRAARFAALKRAEDLARRGIAADPRNVYSHLMLSAAYGFRARMEHSTSYASKSKREIEAAAAIGTKATDVAFARAIWHAEIRISAGGFGAKILGADWDMALKDFEKVRAAWPDRPSVLLTYAHVLLRRDADEYRQKGRDLLTAAVRAPATEAYEKARQSEARQILAALDAGNDKKLDAVLAATLPYQRN